jgi:hypothetical protein
MVFWSAAMVQPSESVCASAGEAAEKSKEAAIAEWATQFLLTFFMKLPADEM